MASALRRTARLARGGDNTTRVAEEGAEDGSWRRTAPRGAWINTSRHPVLSQRPRSGGFSTLIFLFVKNEAH